jgi:hypothetical protein
MVVIAAVVGGACASNPTRSSAAVPLETPEPPPKPALAPIPAPEPPPERPVSAPPAVRPATPPTPAANAPSNTTPTASTGTPVGPLPVPETPTPPAAELKPAGAAANALTAVQVREAYDRTKRKIDTIDRRRLNVGKRADYDSARRFLEQADTAAKANNLMLAQSSVEKAEALADGLR